MPRDPSYTLLTLFLDLHAASKRVPFKSRIHGALTAACSMLWHAYCLYFEKKGQKVNIRWLIGENHLSAKEERDRLLEKLSKKINFTANGTKPCIGPLSKGCVICMNGTWACNYISRLCTRTCDFCKREYDFKKQPIPQTLDWKFATAREHVDYIKTFGIKGVSFSGGEPLMNKEVLLEHIKAIRKEFGRSQYIWMYTNGDLVNDEILSQLRDAGLDEIRFNIAARNYDLAPVVLAREFIPTLTIEIPTIPEDLDLLKELLFEMKSIGVDHLNIHQLYIEKQNHRSLNGRPYSLTTSGIIAVHESEIAALKLLDHASDEKIGLPINYCSSVYKLRFQTRGRRRQKSLALSDIDHVTEAGFLRSLRQRYPPEAGADIVYYEPRVSIRSQTLGLQRNNLKARNLAVAKFSIRGVPAVSAFEAMRDNKADPARIIGAYCEEARKFSFPEDRIEEDASTLRKIATYESIETGF